MRLVTFLFTLFLSASSWATVRPTPQTVDILHCGVDVRLDHAAASYTGTVDIHMRPLANGVRKVVLHAIDLEIDNQPHGGGEGGTQRALPVGGGRREPL